MECNGQKYAYESTSRRVPGRKNLVTDKVYLGRVDPETGKIIPKESRRSPAEIYAKEHGNVVVLDYIQSELGILDDLKESFPGIGGNTMDAAMSQVIDATSFNDIHYVVDGSIIREKLKLRGSLSSATMSDLSEDIGTSLSSMDDFFSRRIKRSSSGFYSLDLKFVSSYSNMNGWAGWGHNRDEEDLKQTNIAMVTGGDGIPVMFRMLPGSIADISVMKCMVEDMICMGCNGCLVMDRGFESAANINALLEMGVEFTVPSNAKAEPIKKLMSQAITDMKESSAHRYHEGRAYKTAEYDLGIVQTDGSYEYVVRVPQNHKGSKENNERFEGSRKLRAFVVYDPKKASDDLNSVISMVAEIELKYENTKHDDPDKVYQALPAFIRKYVTFNADTEGYVHVERKQNSFTLAGNRAGMFVMLASEGTSWDLMMSSYDVRDWVEKAFDIYKNDIDSSRSRTGDPDRARGRFFIKFIALILRIHIQNAIRNHDKDILRTKAKKDSVNGKTVNEIVRTLNSLMAVGNTGDWKLTAVSKNVREIFAFFGLEEPKSGRIIIG
jgi:transposase